VLGALELVVAVEPSEPTGSPALRGDRRQSTRPATGDRDCAGKRLRLEEGDGDEQGVGEGSPECCEPAEVIVDRSLSAKGSDATSRSPMIIRPRTAASTESPAFGRPIHIAEIEDEGELVEHESRAHPEEDGAPITHLRMGACPREGNDTGW